MDALDDRTHHVDFIGMLEALSYTIHKISCEVRKELTSSSLDLNLNVLCIEVLRKINYYRYPANVREEEMLTRLLLHCLIHCRVIHGMQR